MGRSNASLRSNNPIAIPHDGPIYNLLTTSNGQSSKDEDPSLLNALRLCEDTSSSNDALCTLYQDLNKAKSSKEQIQKLQSFKNDKRGQLRGSEGRNRPALNRLLLEWSLSAQTPVPLRRAIQSLISSSDEEDGATTRVYKVVIESLWKSKKAWEDPLVSLETAVNSPSLKSVLQGELLNDCLSFLSNDYISSFLESKSDCPPTHMAETGASIAEILKLLLDKQLSDEIPFRSEFQHFILLLFVCPDVSVDTFNTLGVVYGRLLLCSGSQAIGDIAIQEITSIDKELSHLSSLARLQIVKGIAATLSTDILMDDTSVASKQSPLECSWQYLLHVSKVATDPMVRWGSLKGMSTLASRLKAKKGESTKKYSNLIHETLDVVMQAWENPPMRKLGAAIPGLFQSLVKLIQDEDDLQNLISNVLRQPVNRKGRYLALDMLLPYMTAGQTLDVESLLEGIGDRGSNTGPIADLWKKMILLQWDQINETAAGTNEALETWKTQWIPSLARSLVLQTLSKRRQVAAFCLPRVTDMMKKSKKTLEPYLSSVLVDLFVEIGRLHQTDKRVVIDFSETVQDQLLWAHLELARHCALQKATTTEVQQAIASHLPRSTIQMALTHSMTCIRLLAFQTVHVASAAYGDSIEAEIALWRHAFPFVAKTTDSKEYTSAMLQSLVEFMDRLSVAEESKEADNNKFHSFCVDFLLNEMVTKRGAYPGTIADKEGFNLSLLGCILSFVTQDQSFSVDKATAKHGITFTRRRSASEKSTMLVVLKALFHREVFGSLFSLLFSIWDNTRAAASRCLANLVVAAQLYDMPLPEEFSSEKARDALRARGVFLASSPRQREADTGARILSFLYCSLNDADQRLEYLHDLTKLLKSRLLSMRDQLQAILIGENELPLKTAGDLPLAHGVIQAIALALEHRKLDMLHGTCHAGAIWSGLYNELLGIMSEAIQVSLAVVADLREGETVEGVDGQLKAGNSTKESSSVPLNVNTGAIGANGTFSSVTSTDEDEIIGRLAVQRIVIGSWLLTKETCAAISTLFTLDGYRAPCSAFEKVGALLISTLITLKHAGAAFAARDSLQDVAAVCLAAEDDKDLQRLPKVWSDRLVEEISMSDKVRDSTLRRSTGYALGFLAIMRSEIASKRASNPICVGVLDKLLTFSLPPEDRINHALEQMDLRGIQSASDPLFSLNSGQKRPLVRDEKYEARCRVHALNVIRLIILDSPLASVVTPIVGDAIVSAILGYNDVAWAVRNSATMVFSAAMLRVVDADKNASNTDSTSNNAITITELFRRYPPLASFLPFAMKSCLKDISGIGAADSQIFPILLLLSRMQPIPNSGERADTLAQPFIPLIMDCLHSRHHGIRAAGARALANVCPDHRNLVQRLNRLLSDSLVHPKINWNKVDGILLSFEAIALMCNSQGFPAIEFSLWCVLPLDAAAVPPPSCMTTSIRTLSIIASNTKDSVVGGSALSSSLMGACKRIFSSSGFQGLIGGSELYATVTAVFIRLFRPNIWAAKSLAGFQNALRQMMDLFTSSIFDVRLAAAKAFKKGMPTDVDELLRCSEKTEGLGSPAPILVLSALAKMLLKSLCVELERREGSGSHAPTVRRLSRCFLECFHGYTALATQDDHGGSISPFLDAHGVDLLWSSAHLIAEEDAALELIDECNGETFAASNAVEMMAVVIANRNQTSDGPSFHKVLAEFTHVVQRLNNPQASWRSRHSAALAVEKSAIFSLPHCETEATDHLRHEMVQEVLGMLQDSDPDVRATAARAAHQLGSSATVAPSQLPEVILQDTYLNASSIKGGQESGSSFDQLCMSLFSNCNGLLETIKTFQEETNKSSGVSLPETSLLNATRSRKIFEKEEPNPYNEKLLSNQLAVRSLLDIKTEAILDLDSIKKLSQTCSTCLDSILRNANAGGMAHEMTRFPSIFPSLHSVMLVGAVAIYLGSKNGDHNQKATAWAILDKVKDQSESCIHPEILSCIETIACAEASSPQTQEAILKSCFLLKA